MATNWTDFELRLRDSINEPQLGQVQQAKLVRWANEVMNRLPLEAQLCRARIVVQFAAGVITLVEEDWPGTEAVGAPIYVYGKSGAVWIKYCEKVDAIHEIEARLQYDLCGDLIVDACGDPVYAYDNLRPLLFKDRQEHFYGPTITGDIPAYYGVYRYPVTVSELRKDACGDDIPGNYRMTAEPFEAWAVWFDPMFDYAVGQRDRYFQVQYRRRAPRIDLSLDACGDATQPWFYIQELYEDLVFAFVRMNALFAIGDKRYGVSIREYELLRTKVKWSAADRGDADNQWYLENPDAVIMRGGGMDFRNR